MNQRFSKFVSLVFMVASLASADVLAAENGQNVQLGPRPFYLVDQMRASPLKSKLQSCSTGRFKKSSWSIGHRGAAMQFPEHTVESYTAAARMGAGILECDVTFTKDKQLVCRHAQNDLHTTTNILATPLASKCTQPFTPARDGNPAVAECRVSDLTLPEFKTLNGKMDGANKQASNVDAYLDGTPGWRTDLYATKGTLLTHADSIELLKYLGTRFTPELKAPVVKMPFDGFTQEQYAQSMIDDYKAAGIPPSDVFAQSFNLDDILYWIENEPEFGKQAIYLDGSFSNKDWSPEDKKSWRHQMTDLKTMGVNYIAPPMWVLVALKDGKMVPSLYATEARAAGLNIITWTVERSGFLNKGGGWYYQTVSDAITNEGDVFELMHVLHKDVGIVGLFSDWPATTTYYANCFGLN